MFWGRLNLPQLLIDLPRANLETVLRYQGGLEKQTYIVRDYGDKPLRRNELLNAVDKYMKGIEGDSEIAKISYRGYEDCTSPLTFEHFGNHIKEIKYEYLKE